MLCNRCLVVQRGIVTQLGRDHLSATSAGPVIPFSTQVELWLVYSAVLCVTEFHK